jgi:hypothetical protein
MRQFGGGGHFVIRFRHNLKNNTALELLHFGTNSDDRGPLAAGALCG